MYGYNAEPPIAIPIYTVLPYCVIPYLTIGCYCNFITLTGTILYTHKKRKNTLYLLLSHHFKNADQLKAATRAQYQAEPEKKRVAARDVELVVRATGEPAMGNLGD